MKIIKYALLLSGLFFSQFSLSDVFDETDFRAPYTPAERWCASAAKPNVGTNKEYGCGDSKAEAFSKALKSYMGDKNSFPNGCGTGCLSASYSIDVQTPPTTATFKLTYTEKINVKPDGTYDTKTTTTGGGFVNFGLESKPVQERCPPSDDPQSPANKYTIGPLVVNGVKGCFKPLEPLDCSALKGLQPSIQFDSFETGESTYTAENPPSCITKCAKDEKGLNRCGDCKVVSKSWGRQNIGNGFTKWWANAGTYTGAACGTNESEVPPPEAPKCWETKNGLTMCIQDPAEKCITLNGIQQCEAGCGFVNKEFYCKDKDPEPKPNPNDNDKPLPDVDDNITNPEKPLQDMIKGDFKDVQKGVETRVGQVVTGIGNLENSVDALDNSLSDIEAKLAEANSLAETGNTLLKGIKDGIADNGGECVPSPADDCSGQDDGECDPLTDKNCLEAAGSKSWWNPVYPDGFQGMISENMADFLASDVYQSLTTDLAIGGGGTPNLQMCFNFGFADFGCHSLEIPPYIYSFIKVCFLFYAAILSRRLLIGA